MGGDWTRLPFSRAFVLNPSVVLKRDRAYPFVDMAAVDPARRSVAAPALRAFSGGGSRFASGDTLMARITPCLENGKVARFTAPEGTVGHGSTEFIVIRGREDLSDSAFAYYATRSPAVMEYAIAHMSGTSGRQRVPVDAFDHLDIDLPPLPEQRAIAHILGTLDDKIENNRRTAATLEAMARALYKAWFVDFEPVRANMAGRPSASAPGELAALFPARLVESELGEIPEGWRVGTIEGEYALTMGQSPPGETYNEVGDGVPFYQGRVDFGHRYPSRRVYCTAPSRMAAASDTLVSVRAPVGDLNMAIEDCAIGRGVAAIRHRSGSRSYTYYSMEIVRRKLETFNSEGTVFGAVGKRDFERVRCLELGGAVVSAFETLCLPIDDRIEVLHREAQSVAALRDTLLSKLVSGELSAASEEVQRALDDRSRARN